MKYGLCTKCKKIVAQKQFILRDHSAKPQQENEKGKG